MKKWTRAERSRKLVADMVELYEIRRLDDPQLTAKKFCEKQRFNEKQFNIRRFIKHRVPKPLAGDRAEQFHKILDEKLFGKSKYVTEELKRIRSPQMKESVQKENEWILAKENQRQREHIKTIEDRVFGK